MFLTTRSYKDILLEQNVTLANDTVVVVWISSEDAAAVAQRGFRLIHAPSDYFYLVRTYFFPHFLDHRTLTVPSNRTVVQEDGSEMTLGVYRPGRT